MRHSNWIQVFYKNANFKYKFHRISLQLTRWHCKTTKRVSLFQIYSRTSHKKKSPPDPLSHYFYPILQYSSIVVIFKAINHVFYSISVAQIPSSQPDSLIFQTNFEEFHLVDKEIESTYEYVAKDSAVRLEAEGEENKAMASIVETSISPSNAKYETFLEVTGLSQKSILTPSRILSNHRNVIKPKDVKYRNRVKAATMNDKCNNECGVASPIMKYWTEPYL